MKHFEDLERDESKEIRNLLLKKDFLAFEDKLIEYLYCSKDMAFPLCKLLFQTKMFFFKENRNQYKEEMSKNITYLIDQIICNEVSGISSYLIPKIDIEILEYLFNKYNFQIDTTTAFQSIRLTDNDVMDYILKDFDINIQNENGETFLHKAATIKYMGACSFYPQEDPNEINMPHSDDPKKIKTILQYNPDITIKNNDGKTALDKAEEFGNYRVLEILEDYLQRSIK